MSTTVVTEATTVTGSQSIVVVTSTIAATSEPTVSASTSASTPIGDADTSSAVNNGGAYSNDGSSSSAGSTRGSSAPIGAIVGGVVGGGLLLAFLIVLACLMRKRSKAQKKASPFPPEREEKGPAVIAGLPPNPSNSTAGLRPLSGSFNHSMTTTDAASSLPLLASGMSHQGTPYTGAPSEGHGLNQHRPSVTSLAPSFIMGSSASYPHSHVSHFGQPLPIATSSPSQAHTAAFSGGYPDVHRSAFYEPQLPPGIDPRALPPTALAAGSAATAYHIEEAGGGMSPPLNRSRPLSGSGLPSGAAPADYPAMSEAARMRGMMQDSGDPTWSGSASLHDSHSRRGSHGSTLAAYAPQSPEGLELSPEDAASQLRRPPAAGFPTQPSQLATIPGSVAASEMASSDHQSQSMHSAAWSHRGGDMTSFRLPSIPASSPLILQDAPAFAPPGSGVNNTTIPITFGAVASQMTAAPGSTDLSEGPYNTYTGAAKGQLRVVGSGNKGPSAIAEEVGEVGSSKLPQPGVSRDLKNEEFWLDARNGTAGNKPFRQDSLSESTSSDKKTGSRMTELLDTDHQPLVPDFVTEDDEPAPEAAAPSRPSFWKERTRSSQSITKVFRGSPRVNGSSSAVDASIVHARVNSGANNSEHPPSLSLDRPVTTSASQTPEADADMWKEPSNQPRQTTGMRRWTFKRQSGSKIDDHQVDVDQLFN